MVADKTPNYDDDELVAYLDGELSPERNDLLERQLSIDPELRTRLRKLEVTWDILDELPQSVPTNSFTKSTMELVTSSLQQPRAAKSNWRTFLIWGVMGLILACGTYGLTRSIRMQPYNQLVVDLMVIKNFDAYRKVDTNLGFLKKLAADETFASTVAPPSTSVVFEGGPLDQNRQALEKMSTKQFEEIIRKQEQFEALSPDEKQRFRDFHVELSEHADSARLRAVLDRFYGWLKQLSSDQQVDLLMAKTPEEKLAKFLELRRDQLSRVDSLPESDFEVFDRWIISLSDSIGDRAKTFISDANITERIKKTILETKESAVRAYLRFFREPDEVSNEMLDTLFGQLSSDGKEMMNGDRRNRLMFVQQMLMRPQITDEQLFAFYNTELTPKEREKYDSMPPEVMRDEIRQLYLARKLLIRSRRQ